MFEHIIQNILVTGSFPKISNWCHKIIEMISHLLVNPICQSLQSVCAVRHVCFCCQTGLYLQVCFCCQAILFLLSGKFVFAVRQVCVCCQTSCCCCETSLFLLSDKFVFFSVWQICFWCQASLFLVSDKFVSVVLFCFSSLFQPLTNYIHPFPDLWLMEWVLKEKFLKDGQTWPLQDIHNMLINFVPLAVIQCYTVYI